MRDPLKHGIRICTLACLVLFAAKAHAEIIYDGWTGPDEGGFSSPNRGSASQILISEETTISNISILVRLHNGGSMKFLVVDHDTHEMIFVSDPVTFGADGEEPTWKMSPTFDLTLAPGEYDIGYVCDRSRYSVIDFVAETQGAISSQAYVSIIEDFNNPVFNRHFWRGADLAMRLHANVEPGDEPVTIIERGENWRFLDDGSDQGTAWRQPGFDDSSWEEGAAPLGYGDDGFATRIDFGDDSEDKHITTYFRKSFELESLPTVPATILLRRDDGAAVYLNGERVAVSSLPEAGEIGFDTPATEAAGGADEVIYRRFDIPFELFRPGTNVIAVEVHQASPGSSDMGFDLGLEVSTPNVPDDSTVLVTNWESPRTTSFPGVFFDNWVAQGFTTGGLSSALEAVRVEVRITDLADGPMRFAIHHSEGGRPGAMVDGGLLLGNEDPPEGSDQALVYVAGAGGIPLEPNRQYWVVAASDAPIGSGQVNGWHWTRNPMQSSEFGWEIIQGWMRSIDRGGSWQLGASNRNPLLMEIEGTLVTGEPPVISGLKDVVATAATDGFGQAEFPPVSATDSQGNPVAVDFSPPESTRLAVGVHTITCTASAGGATATATFEVTILENASRSRSRAATAIALRGDPAPGGGEPGTGIPADASLHHFRGAVINADGDLLFEATIDLNTTALLSNSSGSLLPVAVSTGPPADEDEFGRFWNLALNDTGIPSFQSLTSSGIAQFTAGSQVAGGGMEAAGTGAALFRQVHRAPLDSEGQSTTPAHLEFTTGAPPVNQFNDTGLWKSADGLIAREGSPSPVIGQDFGHLYARIVSSPGGRLAFSSTLTSPTSSALFTGDGSNLQALVVEGDPAPGGDTFESFRAEAISPGGQIVFRATVAGEAVTPANNTGMWTDRSGELTLVAREGDLAPCLPSGSTATFESFTDLAIAADGTIFFTAFLQGDEIDSSNDKALWKLDPAGQMHLIAREGDAANNAVSTYRTITHFVTSRSGSLAFAATLTPDDTDPEARRDLGVWMTPPGETIPQLLLRRGDQIQLSPGDSQAIGYLRLGAQTNAHGGSGGYGRVLNDSGQLVLTLSLTGNTSGVFLTDFARQELLAHPGTRAPLSYHLSEKRAPATDSERSKDPGSRTKTSAPTDRTAISEKSSPRDKQATPTARRSSIRASRAKLEQAAADHRRDAPTKSSTGARQAPAKSSGIEPAKIHRGAARLTGSKK